MISLLKMEIDFLKYQAQTSPHPLLLQIKKAKGSYVYDHKGKKYLDFIAGVSANTLGHQPTSVVKAVKDQVDQYPRDKPCSPCEKLTWRIIRLS